MPWLPQGARGTTENVGVATPAKPRGEKMFDLFLQLLGGEKLCKCR